MREIKFRIWDIKYKRMVIPYSIALLSPYKGVKQYHDIHYLDGDRSINPKNAVLMQYTGLKDKNEKEIYEGDILINTFKQIGTVQYDNFSYYIQMPQFIEDGIIYDQPGFSLRDSQLEVIGNIYENPELLGDKK